MLMGIFLAEVGTETEIGAIAMEPVSVLSQVPLLQRLCPHAPVIYIQGMQT